MECAAMDDEAKSKQELMDELIALRSRFAAFEKLQEELHASEKRYKRLVENSPDIVWSFSDKRGTLYASKRVQDILGYSPDHLYENPWLWNESIHPDDRGLVSQAITGFAAGVAAQAFGNLVDVKNDDAGTESDDD